MANLIENEVFGKFDKRADGALKKECMRKFKTGKENRVGGSRVPEIRSNFH